MHLQPLFLHVNDIPKISRQRTQQPCGNNPKKIKSQKLQKERMSIVTKHEFVAAIRPWRVSDSNAKQDRENGTSPCCIGKVVSVGHDARLQS